MATINRDDPRVQSWVRIYRELLSHPSPEAALAREIVLGDVTLRTGRRSGNAGNRNKTGKLSYLQGFRQIRRGTLLANYRSVNPDVTDAEIYRRARVDRRDWRRWLEGELKDTSVIAQRLEACLLPATEQLAKPRVE